MRKLFFIIFFVLVGVIIAYTVAENPHSFSESECKDCHKDVETNPKSLVAPVAMLCKKCHKRGMTTASHPVDITPKITKVPLDMPLTDGMLTCNTCHNLHASRHTAFGEKSYFLRRAIKGREFCDSCHDVNPLEIGHEALLDVAHMARKYHTLNRTQPLDALSVQCIECHDGTIGKQADYVIGAGYREHLWGSHPIGVDYNQSRMQYRGLSPLSRVNKKIRLFNGRIGCGTCHDPYSKLPGQLVMSNDESKLCRECHYDK